MAVAAVWRRRWLASRYHAKSFQGGLGAGRLGWVYGGDVVCAGDDTNGDEGIRANHGRGPLVRSSIQTRVPLSVKAGCAPDSLDQG